MEYGPYRNDGNFFCDYMMKARMLLLVIHTSESFSSVTLKFRFVANGIRLCARVVCVHNRCLLFVYFLPIQIQSYD